MKNLVGGHYDCFSDNRLTKTVELRKNIRHIQKVVSIGLGYSLDVRDRVEDFKNYYKVMD